MLFDTRRRFSSPRVGRSALLRSFFVVLTPTKAFFTRGQLSIFRLAIDGFHYGALAAMTASGLFHRATHIGVLLAIPHWPRCHTIFYGRKDYFDDDAQADYNDKLSLRSFWGR